MTSRLNRALAVLGAIIILTGAPLLPAEARNAVQSTPEVTVDMGVLNSLGPRQAAHRRHHDHHHRIILRRPRARHPMPRRHEVRRRHRATKRTVETRPPHAPRREREAARVPPPPRKPIPPKREARRQPKPVVKAAPNMVVNVPKLPPEPALPAVKPIPVQRAEADTLPGRPMEAPVAPKPAPAHRGRVVAVEPHAPRPAKSSVVMPAKLERGGILGRVVSPVHVDFAAGTASLTPEAKHELDAVAKSLENDNHRRIQLVAYAIGTDDDANEARRLSLSRALNVRAYLIDRGVRNTRMDVRALGNRPDHGKPVDRVDILFLGK